MVRTLCALLAVLLLGLGSAVADEFSSLEEKMSDDEFRSAGLDKLTPEELAALNAWLRTRVGSDIAYTRSADQAGFRSSGLFGESGGEGGPITSRIMGEFDGWSRGSVLKLENGQWWEIVDSASFSVPSMMNPVVTIEPAMLGSWLLKVEGYNRSARVTRVR
jgi:hypothetical protein